MNWFNTTKNGYRYDKRIFSGFVVIYLIAVFYLAYINNFNFHYNIYFKCEGVEPCLNPYFNMECSREWLYGKDCYTKCTESWCYQEYLPSGIYGNKPPNYMNWLPTLLILSLVFGIGLNHFLHNQGKLPEIEIRFSKNKVINLTEALSKFEFEDEKTDKKDEKTDKNNR